MNTYKIIICVYTTLEYNEHLLHCANLSCMVENSKIYLSEEITRKNKYSINYILIKGGKGFIRFVVFIR